MFFLKIDYGIGKNIELHFSIIISSYSKLGINLTNIISNRHIIC